MRCRISTPRSWSESAEAKYLIVQNATPATSVPSSICGPEGHACREITTAAAVSVFTHPHEVAGRFSTLCGDGAALTVDFDTPGKENGRKRSAALFDPEKDALFIYGVRMGDKTLFVSFLGNLHIIDFSGEVAAQETPWTFLGAKERAAHWRPGGYPNIAYSPSNGQLYLGMHPDAGGQPQASCG